MLFNIRFSKNEGRESLISQSQTERRLPENSEAGPVFACVLPELIESGNFLLRKEVIHPHVPVGIPCYDLTPITSPTLDVSLLTVRITASSITSSHGLTGGVYKPRERIHRDMADSRLLAIPASWSRVADSNPY